MARIPTATPQARVQRDMRNEIRQLFISTGQRIAARVLLNARADDSLPSYLRPRLVRYAIEQVESMFLAPDRSGPFGEDGESALAPFPAIINKYYAIGVYRMIKLHTAWMERRVPADILTFLRKRNTRPAVRRQADSPFLRRDDESVEEHIARLESLRIFHPNPLAELDPNRTWIPLHRWQSPRGYRLSDALWEISNTTRQSINLMIEDALREGWGAQKLADMLVRFLNPDAAALRTNKPYGSDASWPAMRLARTEIARAANQAAFVSAYLNPYVDKVDAVRSSRGDPTCPICPLHATIGIGGERLRPPYDITSVDMPPWHPNDMCRVEPVVTDSPSAVTDRLRAIIQDEDVNEYIPVTTPVQPDALAQQLLGPNIYRVLLQNLVEAVS